MRCHPQEEKISPTEKTKRKLLQFPLLDLSSAPADILLDGAFPVRLQGLAAADGGDRLADGLVVQTGAFAVAAVGDGAVSSDAEVAGGFDGVDVGPQKEKFPSLFLLLPDHGWRFPCRRW